MTLSTVSKPVTVDCEMFVDLKLPDEAEHSLNYHRTDKVEN